MQEKKEMDADSDDFVSRRKSSRPRRASVKQVLLDESGSSDGKYQDHLNEPQK